MESKYNAKSQCRVRLIRHLLWGQCSRGFRTHADDEILGVDVLILNTPQAKVSAERRPLLITDQQSAMFELDKLRQQQHHHQY